MDKTDQERIEEAIAHLDKACELTAGIDSVPGSYIWPVLDASRQYAIEIKGTALKKEKS